MMCEFASEGVSVTDCSGAWWKFELEDAHARLFFVCLCLCTLKCRLWWEQDESLSLLMLSFHSIVPSITFLLVNTSCFLRALNNNNLMGNNRKQQS